MPRYKYTQESGTDFKVVSPDKADAQEDINEVRQILDDLGELLGHSKFDDSYPRDGTEGGKITKIAFPATQVPSADANTLDDYEEGTWTPTLEFGGASVNMAYTIQTGLYTKIGNLVTITGRILLSAKGTSTGDATMTGLPFTSKNVDGAYTSISLRFDNITFANQFQGVINKNAVIITLLELTEAGVGTALTEGNFANDSLIDFSAIYFTD